MAHNEPTHNGVPCEIEDSESHRSEQMLKITRSDGMSGWVFAEEVDGICPECLTADILGPAGHETCNQCGERVANGGAA